ncbi:MAG: PAS domain S-box protein [Gemmatimonadota bacterium]
MITPLSEALRSPGRLAALETTALLDSAAEESFDRLTSLAARLLDAPMALVSLVDADRQFFKSCFGLSEPWGRERETPLSHSFCQHAVHSGEPLLISDARRDPLVRENAAIVDLGMIAYAGIPLVTSSGHALGACCVIDHKPRQWTEDEVRLLSDLAASVMTEIELRAAVREADRVTAELRARERENTAMLQAVAHGIYGLDRRGCCTFPNSAEAEMLGYAPEEVMGRNMHGLIHHGTSFRAEFGSHLISTPGHVQGAVVSFTDISERKQAEDAVPESEEGFRQLAEHVDQVFWMFDPDFTELYYANPAYAAVFGLSVESLYRDPHSFLTLVHSEDVGELSSAMLRLKEEKQTVEYRIRRPDGEERWLRSRGFSALDGNGEVHRLVWTTQDITEIVRSRTELERSERHYRRLVQTAPQPIYALDAEGRFTEANPALGEILGRSAAELLGEPFASVIAPEDLPGVVEARRQSHESGEGAQVEFHIVRPSGERRLVHMHLATAIDEGRVLGTHGIGRDITEERAHEGRMRLLTSILDGMEQAICISEIETLRPLYCNPAWMRLFGCDSEKHLGDTPEVLLPDEAAREQLGKIRQALRQDGHWSGRISRKRMDDGRVVPIEAAFGTSAAEDGTILVFSISHDATHEIDREERLRRAERLASLGTLIGGVAHELNNPLHAIRNFADLMLMDERNAEDREALEIMQREADRAARIVDDLRLFARQTQEKGEVSREAVDLNEVVQHVLKVRGYTLLSHGIRMREDLSEDLPKVWANRGEIEQILLNLIINAEQALEENGSEDRLLIVRTRQSRMGAAVHVVDNGPGIAPEHLERIFDPFFTTKPPGQGTGLGLSLVYSIVEEHGGDLRAESQPGRGAAFTLDLPYAPAVDRVDSADPVGDPGDTPDRPLRILVVDDEVAVRRAAVRFLGRRGHEVDEAIDGAEALRWLNDAQYDVILSDLRMPGLDGQELIQRLRERGDGMERRVILLTGDATRAHLDIGVPVLTKPIQLAEVARVVEQLASGRDFSSVVT